MTNYSSIHIKKIRTAADLKNLDNHGKRIGGQNATFRASVDDDRTHLNQHYIFLGDEPMQIDVDAVDLNEQWKEMQLASGGKVPKNGSMATEVIFSASPEFFENLNKQELQKWINDTLEIAAQKYEDQIFGARVDLDEKTPHLSVFVQPWYIKEVQQRELKEGARKRKSRRKPRVAISHNKIFGNRFDYAAAHTWYNDELKKRGHNLERGIEGGQKNYGKLKRNLDLKEEQIEVLEKETIKKNIEADLKKFDAQQKKSAVDELYEEAEKYYKEKKQQADIILSEAKEKKAKFEYAFEKYSTDYKKLKKLMNIMNGFLDAFKNGRKFLEHMFPIWKHDYPEYYSPEPSPLSDIDDSIKSIEHLNEKFKDIEDPDDSSFKM